MTRNLRILASFATFFVAFFIVLEKGLSASDAKPSKTENQIETTIIHVDKYGVYVPNLVFYWDPGMNKQKVAALTGIAEQLRNKNAVITYATTSDITRDKRPVLVDIAAFKRETPPAGDSAPLREPSRPSPAGSERSAPVPSKDEAKPANEEAALQKPRKEAESGQTKPVLPGPPGITRAEVTNFVHHCIDAAQSKDIERSITTPRGP